MQLNREALQRLRWIIDAVSDDRLHMAVIEDTGAKCGTAYCAAGWAATDPWFQEKGLTLARLNANRWVVTVLLLSRVFGIGAENARRLFGSYLTNQNGPHPVGRNEVLWNIDRLLDGGMALSYKAAPTYLRTRGQPFRLESVPVA